MTAEEFFKTKILPMQRELNALEIEYDRLWCSDKAKEAGVDKISCDNCAFSSVLDIGDHNVCLNGKCTCCNAWCYQWTSENEVSKYLRKYHKHDDVLARRLRSFFGQDFIKCGNVELLLEAVTLLDKMKGQ